MPTNDDRIGELYEGSASDFVKRRNALAKELKAGGDEDAAAEVAGLKKPSAAAWALNQGVRADPGAAKALAKAGERLAKAQASVLEGKDGARGRLRDAKGAEQGAIEAIVAAAVEQAPEKLSASTLGRIRETLSAAAGDAEVAGEIAEGRVTEDHRAVGLGGDLSAALAAAPRKPKDGAARKRAKKAVAAAEKQRADAARRVDRARKALGQAQQQVADAKAEVKDAERSLEDAENELERVMG